jgi:primosomal replication protein N
MQGKNIVVLLGDVKGAPTLLNGSCLPITLVVVERQKQGTSWQEVPTTIGVAVFGKRAAALSKILSDGKRVLVTGRLAEGRKGLYVSATDIVLCGGGKRPEAEHSNGAGADDEIPF